MKNSHNRKANLIKEKTSKGRMITIFPFLLLISMLLISCDKKKEQAELLIGAAASMETAMKEVLVLYNTQNPEVKINTTFAGSGTIEQQIREGAPIDIFISAAEKQMDALSKDQYIIEASREDLLNNKIVLIVPKGNKLGISDFTDIDKAGIIALGDAESVPAGQYAKEIFEGLGSWEEVKAKASFGKDVTEVLAWVSAGNADAGVVYATDATLSDKVEVIAYAPEGSNIQAVYPVAILKNTKEKQLSEELIKFFNSKEAEKVFIKYGFGIVD